MKKIILIILLIPIYLYISTTVHADDIALYKKKYEDIQTEFWVTDNIVATNISFDFDILKDNNDVILIDITANIPLLSFDAKKLDYIIYIEYEYNDIINTITIDKSCYQTQIINPKIYESDDIFIYYSNGKIKMLFNIPIDSITITQMNYHISSNFLVKIDDNYAYVIDEVKEGLIFYSSDILKPYDDIKPVITIDDDIYTSIDSPILPSAIKLMAKAMDNISGDISNRIYISDTNYSGKQIGDYYIVLTVIDDYENRCDKKVNIHVKDMTPPIISGNNYYEVGIINNIDVLDIYKNLNIYDNVSEEFMMIIDDSYTPNKDKLGEYKVIYRVFDEANNESRFEINIKVNDDQSPIIIGNDINTYISNPIDIMDILNTFDYFDNITDNESLVVTYNTNYDKKNAGAYYFKLIVADMMNNISEKQIAINVIDDEKPFFIVDEKIVKNPLNHEQLLKYFNID